jgi:hypothetical protein
MTECDEQLKEVLLTLRTEPPRTHDEAQRWADNLNCAVVCYDMYGKEVARAGPKEKE